MEIVKDSDGLSYLGSWFTMSFAGTAVRVMKREYGPFANVAACVSALEKLPDEEAVKEDEAALFFIPHYPGADSYRSACVVERTSAGFYEQVGRSWFTILDEAYGELAAWWKTAELIRRERQ